MRDTGVERALFHAVEVLLLVDGGDENDAHGWEFLTHYLRLGRYNFFLAEYRRFWSILPLQCGFGWQPILVTTCHNHTLPGPNPFFLLAQARSGDQTWKDAHAFQGITCAAWAILWCCLLDLCKTPFDII